MGISTKIEELINLANKGDVQAQNDLGECYYTGEGVEQDYVKDRRQQAVRTKDDRAHGSPEITCFL